MKETGITLSIIIPVYNVMAYLRPCLDGLLSQTCPAGFSYEVLLADDGSTDGSGAVCDEYAAAYRQVRALHRENGGQSAARNQAIRAAEGAWLAFVDSDDLVRPEFLAALAGEDIPTYAEQMFEAGADLTGRDAEDVFCSDFKVFSRGDAKFGVGQSIYMTDKSRAAAEALVGPFLPEASRREGLPMIFYMFTDMKTQSTDLMYCGNAAEQIVREAFHVEPKDGKAWLPGVVSRKKQLIPPLLAALQAHQE